MPDSSSSRDFQIYLSSTLDDLREERQAAIDILRRHGRVMDSYRAGPQPTVQNCLADVRGSDLYVLILGRRYGWVPGGESDPAAKSITEMEYDECTASPGSPIPRLVFVRTTTPDRFNDDNNHPQTAARMRRFRERASAEQQAYTFDTLDQFAVALIEPVMTARAEWLRGTASTAAAAVHATIRAAPWVLGQTLRPLPGYPVLGDAARPVLTGGAIVDLVLSHDHATEHGIVITSLKPEWTHQPPSEARDGYEVDGDALPPQGFFSPERFTLTLAGAKFLSAFWPRSKNEDSTRVVDGDLLHTDPPRQIRLDHRADDTVTMEGVIRATVPGRYTLRWTIGYTVAGQMGTVTTDPLEFVCHE